MSIERRALKIIRDRASGAAQIAVQTSELLADARDSGYPPKKTERLGQRIVRAHPAMGSVWNAVHAEEPLEFARQLRGHIRKTLQRCRDTLPGRGTAVTLSYSSTVTKVLGRKNYRVIVAESLPGGEGKHAALKLRRAGAEASVVPDATLVTHLRMADFAIVGADAVTPLYVVNKIGTHLLCLAAQATRTPVYAVADATKLVHADWPLPAPGTKQIFECTPRELFTTVLCDLL